MILSTIMLAVVGGIETFVMGILGVFGTVIMQGIKKYSGVNGNTALTLTVAVSVVLAIAGAFASDAFLSEGHLSIGSIVNGAIVVFGVATLAYKYLLSKDAPLT